MKIIINRLLAFLAVLIFLGCGSTKNIPQNEVVQTIPCTGKEYRTNNDHFRASALGVSPNQQMSKDIALQNARQTLLASIEVTVSLVVQNYGNQTGLNAGTEYMNKFESLGVTAAKQSVRGIIPICEVSTKDKDQESTSYNQYKYYVSVEVASSKVLENISKALSNDEVLKVDYNYERFKKTYEEEMEKLRN